jgi:hypothetical protein
LAAPILRLKFRAAIFVFPIVPPVRPFSICESRFECDVPKSHNEDGHKTLSESF